MLSQIVFQSGEVINQAPVKGFWDYFIQLYPAVIASGALWIAYQVYKNMDAKKVFVKEQVTFILKFIEHVEKTQLIFYTRVSPELVPSMSFTLASSNHILKNLREQFAEMFGKPLYVASDFWQVEMFDYLGNIMLPRTIRNELQKFYLSSAYPFTSVTSQELQGLSGVVILHSSDDRKSKRENIPAADPRTFLFHRIDHPYYQNAESFLQGVLSLKKSILKWCEAYKIEPNIDEL